jgi:hypothetical protein
MTEKDESYSPQIANSTMNENKKNSNLAYQSTVFHDI